jgi:lysophospholipase L1-like esterase
MRRATRQTVSSILVGVALVGAVVIGVVVQSAPGSAASARGVTAHTSVHGYLALGDSVTFGYRESDTSPSPNYLDASNFASYAEDVGVALGYQLANASCPGETSASFISKSAQSVGCESSPGGGPGYRSVYPLHVSYKGTQLQYGVAYLKAHPHTQLVSLMIGANDAFLCEETTSDQCVSEFPAVLKQITANVTTILSDIRSDAHYKGQIVIVNYYSLSYASSTETAESKALNAALDGGAKAYHVQIADGYGAFEAAALQSGGNACTAGLLTQLTGGGCGIHPSVAGQAVLALAVEKVIKK